MAEEERNVAVEADNNGIVENEQIIEYQENTETVNAFDWNQTKKMIYKSINIGSIIFAYIGIILILSYPIIHIINYFCHIDGFLNSLPMGYTSLLKPTSGDGSTETLILISLCILCIIISSKITIWLAEKHSIFARIFCILSGGLFMYCMISEKANTIFLTLVTIFVSILLFVYVFIPIILGLNSLVNFAPFFPTAKSYLRFVFSLLPHTKKLSDACAESIAKDESKQIVYAKQQSEHTVYVKLNDGSSWTWPGKLKDYSSHSVTIMGRGAGDMKYSYYTVLSPIRRELEHHSI